MGRRAIHLLIKGHYIKGEKKDKQAAEAAGQPPRSRRAPAHLQSLYSNSGIIERGSSSYALLVVLFREEEGRSPPPYFFYAAARCNVVTGAGSGVTPQWRPAMACDPRSPARIGAWAGGAA